MKKIIGILALMLSFCLAAEEQYINLISGKPVPNDGKHDIEALKARDQRILKKTGGFITRKAEGPVTRLVDTRSRPLLTIDEVARLYKLGTHLNIDIEKNPRNGLDPLDLGRSRMSSCSNLLIVVVVENDKHLPALSVFPEERIGIVNADKLVGGNDPTALETRVAKEIWRAIGFIGGIGFSPHENDMMQPYYSLEELDKNVQAYIQPMNMAKMQPLLTRFGVKKSRRLPYRLACQQGWAPAPTNQYQKAVWDEVHAMPTSPLKIKPETKKVEK